MSRIVADLDEVRVFQGVSDLRVKIVGQKLILTALMMFCFILPQGWGKNHVLYLDGNKSYVRLPSNAFDGLDEATVEGWVRWEKLTKGARFFDFGNQEGRMSVYGVGRVVRAEGVGEEARERWSVWVSPQGEPVAALSETSSRKLEVLSWRIGLNPPKGSSVNG
jgi:hypothetical protein